MKLSAIVEARSPIAKPGPAVPPGVDRANALRGALGVGIPYNKLTRMFGVSKSRLSAIKRRLIAAGWKPGMPISQEMLTKVRTGA